MITDALAICQTVHHHGHWNNACDHISLTYDERFLRRKSLQSAAGQCFLVDLAKTTSLNEGDALELDSGALIEVRAADEDLLEITGPDLTRLAWHIGNRHTPCQIETRRLVIQRNHVMRDMLQKLGANIADFTSPFSPEGGGPMATGGHMVTATETLTLAQWFSPGFPVGAFVYSHGLEWAIENGAVHDSTSAKDWITQVLEHGAGWNDTLLLAAAYRAPDWAAVRHVDAIARALAPSRERLKETDLQGAAFCKAVSDLSGFAMDGLSYPVAAGWAAQRAELSLELTAQMYLHSFLGNLASVAMRLVPLGQTVGQALIRELMPVCIEIVRGALSHDLEDLTSTAFLADIAAMKHETQHSRIFRT